MNAGLIEKIEDYLDGRINRQELQNWAREQNIRNMEEQIEWVQNARLAVETAGLREQLKETLPQPEQEKTSSSHQKLFLAIAASIIISAAVFWTYQLNLEPPLYAEYEYVDPGLPVLMSQSEKHLLYDALTYYSEERYEIAAEKLQAILPQFPKSDTLHYYLGASLLYQGNVTDSEAALSRVLSNEASEFKERAQWLMVLAALRDEAEDQETLKRLQPVLASPDHQFHEQAQKLKQDLD